MTVPNSPNDNPWGIDTLPELDSFPLDSDDDIVSELERDTSLDNILNSELENIVVKTEPEDSVVVKTEPEDSVVVKTEPEDSVVVKTEPDDSLVVKTEPEDSVVVKTEPEDSVVVKTEPNHYTIQKNINVNYESDTESEEETKIDTEMEKKEVIDLTNYCSDSSSDEDMPDLIPIFSEKDAADTLVSMSNLDDLLLKKKNEWDVNQNKNQSSVQTKLSDYFEKDTTSSLVKTRSDKKINYDLRRVSFSEDILTNKNKKWDRKMNSNGKEYWVNRITEESTWNKPKDWNYPWENKFTIDKSNTILENSDEDISDQENDVNKNNIPDVSEFTTAKDMLTKIAKKEAAVTAKVAAQCVKDIVEKTCTRIEEIKAAKDKLSLMEEKKKRLQEEYKESVLEMIRYKQSRRCISNNIRKYILEKNLLKDVEKRFLDHSAKKIQKTIKDYYQRIKEEREIEEEFEKISVEELE